MRILHLSTRMILGGSQENTVLSCEGQARLGHDVHLAFGPVYGPEGSLVARVEEFNRRCRDGLERVRPIGRRDGAGTGDGDVPESTTAGIPRHSDRPEPGDGAPEPRAACVRPEHSPVLPITMHVVSTMRREVRPPTDARCLGDLRRLIRSVRPDVVHTHSSKAGVIGRIAAWKVREERNSDGETGRECEAGLPGSPRPTHGRRAMAIVHTIHGPPFMPVDGSAISPVKTVLVNRVYEAAERFAARRCDVIVSVADAMTAQFLARGIGRPEQYITVRSGMEIDAFVRAAPGESRREVRDRLGIAPDAFVVGTVARLAQHKGHDDLLDALAPLIRPGLAPVPPLTPRSPRAPSGPSPVFTPPPGITLLWVGDGWWRERLLLRARGMGLRVRELDRPGATPGTGRGEVPEGDRDGGEIVVTGLVGPDRVPGLMRAMDVLAHPSSREGLPRTVPQALLCGVCPVAYDADGTREVCIDGKTGRLVGVGDVEGLARAVGELFENEEIRRELGERGRRMCVGMFSAETMVAHLERVYQQALVTGTR